MPIDRSDWISANVYRGFYERAERMLLQRLLSAGSCAVDVGAHRGLYTAVMASLIGPGGLVVAFEPNPRCAGVLEELVASAGLRNVVVYRAAASDRDGVGILRDVKEGHSGLATLRHREEKLGPELEVPTIRLDAIPELQGREIDFLKIDVEGFEDHVLAGAHELSADRRIAALLLEVSPQLVAVRFVDDLLAELASDYAGYAVTEVGSVRRRTRLVPVPPGAAERTGDQYNLLVLRRDRFHAVADLVGA